MGRGFIRGRAPNKLADSEDDFAAWFGHPETHLHF